MQALSGTISRLLLASYRDHSVEHFEHSLRLVHAALEGSLLGKESHESIRSIIHAPNSALSQKIFEAEQDNLYVEPISAGRVLIGALTSALQAISSTARSGAHVNNKEAVFLLVSQLMAAPLQQAATLFGDLLHSRIGAPTSYQANLFQYFYLCFALSVTVILGVEGSGGTTKMSAELCALQLTLRQHSDFLVTDGSASEQHPWIVAELAKFRAA